MLSLLVARWPGSRSASLCFVAWLELTSSIAPGHRPGRQQAEFVFLAIR